MNLNQKTIEDIAAIIATKNPDNTQSQAITQHTVKGFIKTLLGEIVYQVTLGNTVHLINFCTFEKRLRKQRQGYNPATKKPMTIPAYNAVKTQFGKGFKDRIKGIKSEK